MEQNGDEEKLLRSVALQNAKSILLARQRAEEELVRAKEALERKTQELAHSLAMMRATLESTTDGILVTDGGGKVTGFNDTFVTMWQLPREIMDARKHRQLLEVTSRYFKDPPQFVARVEDIYAASPPESYDLLELADGRVFERFSRIQFVDERDVGRVWSFRDITERRRVDNELRQYAADLSKSDRRKNEFLAMLAHELRNPLALIRNAVHVLQLTGGNAAAVKSASEMLERQVGQMVRLVDDLLDVSRISRGKTELCKEQVELRSVVNQAVEAARSLVECMEHELTATLPPQPVYLNADPIRLAQVVGNLLNNACKFTNKGGRIWLTVEREGEQAVIRVRDNGIGIAADQHSRIFDMFTQVDTSLERSVGGLGIGLMLVKNLVEMHDGMVEVHSAGLGRGSEFVARLPILVETAKPPPDPTVSEPTPTTARRILVVDDNRDSAESLAMLLNLMGNETHIAYDGLEAVEAAATVKPDVILLDIGLPKLNGYEACRRIREQPWGRNMVLVALTGWGQEEDRQKSREAGFDGHIVKPVDHAALTKLLAETGASAPPVGDAS